MPPKYKEPLFPQYSSYIILVLMGIITLYTRSLVLSIQSTTWSKEDHAAYEKKMDDRFDRVLGNQEKVLAQIQDVKLTIVANQDKIENDRRYVADHEERLRDLEGVRRVHRTRSELIPSSF